MFEVVFSHLLKRVSEGALSPDGTVLATASHDGFIKFWQMYIEAGQDKPRLDHSFLPAQHSQMELVWTLDCLWLVQVSS